tara:strand:- start:35 stop:688 length:654 start_codon:yes stop_codon:yes gene_type:complete
MSTTYLTIVNHVLRRMREDEITNITDTTYSKMVGDFVNDAKKEVQNSHDWSALRSAVTVTTSSGTSEYSITGSKEDPKIISAINDTQNLFLTYQTPVWMDNAYFNTDAPSGAPDTYTFNGIDSNGDVKIKLYPTPDASYSLRFSLVIRPAELLSNTDEVTIPYLPIVHQTIALLARERGETGGTTSAEYFAIANKYLSDAIAHDAYQHPEEFIFRPA